MKRIPLSSNKYALVDDNMFDYLNHWHWFFSITKNGYGYAEREENHKKIKMHRFILNVSGKTIVDHINRNTLDNRKENLRIATRSENNQNKVKQKNNKSGYIGVSFSKDMNKFRADIYRTENGKQKQYNVGFFTNPLDAAKARDMKALELYGKFARLNIIP